MSNNSGASTSSQKLSAANADDSSTGDGMMGDDLGWWDCSLCTYKNSNDKFKCEICDLRRGTSTRKPRCNADTIVAQVVKQQEQIRQQTKVKPPKSRSSAPNDPNVAATSNDSSSKAKSIRPKSSSNSKNRSGKNYLEESETEDEHLSYLGYVRPKLKKKKVFDFSETKVKKKQDSKAGAKDHRIDKHKADDDDGNDDTTDPDHTDVSDDGSSRAFSQIYRSASESSLATSHYSSSSASSPEPTNSPPVLPTKSSKNPSKITPIEVNGNLIKYSPPTSSGRTGLIIDKKRFSQHSVTVNDVTITFTEFATRQNNYVRKKKKKRRDVSTKAKTNNGNGKSHASSTKDENKSISNNDSAGARQDDP